MTIAVRFHVTVDDEGEYGFSIVVEGAGGLGGFPPQPGDTPELLGRRRSRAAAGANPSVEVDSRRVRRRQLVVRWEAEDDNLEPRPISLFYSSRPAGPWTTIATSLENIGEFDWPLERHVPRRIYLKLEARDTAGNVAAYQTSEPCADRERTGRGAIGSGCRRSMSAIRPLPIESATDAYTVGQAQRLRPTMAKSSSTKSAVVPATTFLASPDKHPAGPVCAVIGDETFLKREVLAALRQQVLGSDQDEFSLTTFAGRSGVPLRDVLDALATVSLFGSGRRLVIVEEADDFVSENRAELEDYVAKPHRGGVLVLDVKTWPSTTRLAKAVAASGLTIECKSLNEPQTKRWLADRAKSRYDVRLDAAAADALLELLPPELGILDQELVEAESARRQGGRDRRGARGGKRRRLADADHLGHGRRRGRRSRGRSDRATWPADRRRRKAARAACRR